ncbi:MAG TPA: DNA repair protein RecO [Sulfuriferula sp.]|nr:DNA repair protein RecO [Sulfuriferula sp.]
MNARPSILAPERSRVDNAAGFVLHSYPFRETSLIVETFTRAHGRVALVARGARRPRSQLRGLVQAFTPLLLSWAGKGELRTLHRAEWQGGLALPQGMGLLCGFYINELMLKLLAREDPHEHLFADYQAALQALSSALPQNAYAAILRRFEKRLLAELGYAQPFEFEADSGPAVLAQQDYVYVLDRGALPAQRANGHVGMHLSGKTLLDMAADDYHDPATLMQSKQLMRLIINHHLGGQTLHARELLKDLQQL